MVQIDLIKCPRLCFLIEEIEYYEVLCVSFAVIEVVDMK